jgi:hypothetical protein
VVESRVRHASLGVSRLTFGVGAGGECTDSRVPRVKRLAAVRSQSDLASDGHSVRTSHSSSTRIWTADPSDRNLDTPIFVS